MAPLVLDVETTTYAKGNPFSRRNRLCYVGTYRQGGNILVGNAALLPLVGREIAASSLLIGFNIKFDLHWLRRSGCTFAPDQRVWDCQLAHFLLTNQQTPYPSLGGVCESYGIPGKDPTIERDYWDRGIDTSDIPSELMLHYLAQDLKCTMEVYEKQVEEFKTKPQLYKLFQIQCQDLLVLQEMEWNGLVIDLRKARQEAERIHEQLRRIESELHGIYPSVPINFDSGDHLSCFLYGGIISIDRKEPCGVFKSGKKIGEVRYRIITDVYELPQSFIPIDGSALKKEGYWSTDESFLRQLKGPRQVLALLLERSSLGKLLDYYEGYPELIAKKDWPENTLHGQLNQCVVITGRLSSSQPNTQNIESSVKEIIVSRYD